MPRSWRRLEVLLACGALLVAACVEQERPVAKLRVEPPEIELPYPEFTSIRLVWEMTDELAGLEGEPRVFLHLVDGEGEVLRTFDHDFPRRWSTGSSADYEVTLYQSALSPALAEEGYALTAGLYDSAGHRWALEVDGGELHSQEYRVALVNATPSAAAPKFFFSPTWLPVESGTDLQVLARRWLGDDGVLRLADIPGSGHLRLRIGIPRGTEVQEMVLENGAAVTAVTLEASCGGFTTEISGPGSHVVKVPIEPGPEADCDISFATNYYLLSKDNMSRQTLALEGLSWSSD